MPAPGRSLEITRPTALRSCQPLNGTGAAMRGRVECKESELQRSKRHAIASDVDSRCSRSRGTHLNSLNPAWSHNKLRIGDFRPHFPRAHRHCAGPCRRIFQINGTRRAAGRCVGSMGDLKGRGSGILPRTEDDPDNRHIGKIRPICQPE